MIRRMPKRGFSNAAFKTVYATINVGDLEALDAGTTVDEAFLRERNLVRGKAHGVKILGDGELTKRLTVVVDRVSDTARQKIESAGGTVTLK